MYRARAHVKFKIDQPIELTAQKNRQEEKIIFCKCLAKSKVPYFIDGKLIMILHVICRL